MFFNYLTICVFLIVQACTPLVAPREQSSEQSSEGLTRTTSIERILGNNAKDPKCTPGIILACLDSNAGRTCFDRCDVETDRLFCNEQLLAKCKANKGNNSCYNKYCGEPATSGAFRPKSGSSSLIELPKSGIGYETYDQLRFGTPKTIERIKELANRVFRKSGYPVFIGDISDRNGGNGGVHAEHIGGVDVDIAVMGNTPGVFCGTYKDSCYSRPAMRKLIQEITAMGGAPRMLFNDPVLLGEFSHLSPSDASHDNHIHIRWRD